jgi:hypothetical protein
MPFPCPACAAPVPRHPPRWALRCKACGAILRARPVDGDGPHPAYQVEVAGRPETRRRVEVPWDEAQGRRLAAWLFWSSLITLGLVLVLYALARFVP